MFQVKRANELSCPVTLLLQLVPRSPRALEGGRRQEAGCRRAQSLLPALAGAALGQANVPVVALTDAWPDRGDKARGKLGPGPGEDPAEEGGVSKGPKGEVWQRDGEKVRQGLGGRTTAPGMEKRSFNFLRYQVGSPQGGSQPYTPHRLLSPGCPLLLWDQCCHLGGLGKQ